MLENIIIGVTVILVSSMIAYLYHIRQLYATAPVLFQKKSVDGKGLICQIVISNRGNQVEEGIELELDPAINASVVATNTPQVTQEGSIIKIERIHKKQEANLLLLVENDYFDSSKIISVSSSSTDGQVCKTLKDIPINYGLTSLIFALLLSAIPALYYSYQIVGYVEEKIVQKNLKPITREGWGKLDKYSNSALEKSYSNKEFPVRLKTIGQKHDFATDFIPENLKKEWDKIDEKKDVLLNYEINNKTATDLGVMAFRKNGDNTSPYYIKVPPMSSEDLTIPVSEKPGDKNIQVEFSFQMNNEWLDHIEHSIDVDTIKDAKKIVKPVSEVLQNTPAHTSTSMTVRTAK